MKGRIAALVAVSLLSACADGGSETTAAASPERESATESPSEQTVEVPDVVGMEESEATQLLQAEGFRVVTERADPRADSDIGTVESQKPAGGQEAREGGFVRLAVYGEAPKLQADAGMQESIFEGTLEGSRDDIIRNMESIVESVDRFEYDVDGDAVIVDSTSGYGTEEYISEEAWELTRHLAQLWSEDFWDDVNRTEDWFPALHLSVDNLIYRCPGDVMDRLADRRLSRSDWEQSCRA